jgi:CO/xanthine dehydrogenase Mo-binding subunit
LVSWDLEELPPVIDPETALRPNSVHVHDLFQTNLIGAFSVGRGDVEVALARAPHRLRRRFYHHRYATVPMECRGVVSAYDPRTERSGTQPNATVTCRSIFIGIRVERGRAIRAQQRAIRPNVRRTGAPTRF